MTAPVNNNSYTNYPTPLKILATSAVYSIPLSPIAAVIFKTPKPVPLAIGLMGTAALATRGWELFQSHKTIPIPKKF